MSVTLLLRSVVFLIHSGPTTQAFTPSWRFLHCSRAFPAGLCECCAQLSPFGGAADAGQPLWCQSARRSSPAVPRVQGRNPSARALHQGDRDENRYLEITACHSFTALFSPFHRRATSST